MARKIASAYPLSLLTNCSLVLAFLTLSSIASSETLEIDFAKTDGVVGRVAAGLLVPWGINPIKPPLSKNSKFVEPLELKWVRHNISHIVKNRERVSNSTRYIVNLSGGSYPWNKPPPYANSYFEWLANVEEQVKVAARHNLNVIWDIWNEPEGAYFVGDDYKIRGKTNGKSLWRDATWQKFYETYKVTFRKIRSLDPDALISGPGIGAGDLTGDEAIKYLESFKDYAVEHNVVPDFWSLHYPRDKLQEYNQRFESWNLPQVRTLVTEYLIPKPSKYPSAIFWTLAYLENSNVYAAIRGNWGNRGDKWGSLSGLLNYNAKTSEFEKTGAWWAYYYYAALKGKKISNKHGAVRMLGGVESDTATFIFGALEYPERGFRYSQLGIIDTLEIVFKNVPYLGYVEAELIEVPFGGRFKDFRPKSMSLEPVAVVKTLLVIDGVLELDIKWRKPSSGWFLRLKQLEK